MKSKITLTTITAIFILILISFASALRIDSVTMNPSQISQGQVTKINILIKNNDDQNIEDISISLELSNLPFAPYNSGSEFSISEIKEDKIKEAEFSIIALNNAQSGIYKIPLKIEYKEENQAEGTPSKIKSSMISITINSEPVIEVVAEDGLLLKDKDNTVSMKIVNKGLADIKFLEVRAGASTYYNLLSQSKVYIGDIDSDDFQNAEFKVFFSEKSPNTINFPITITYRDVFNKEYNENFNVQLKIYSQKQAESLGLVKKNNTIYYVIGIAAIIILYIIYRLIRRRKRNEGY